MKTEIIGLDTTYIEADRLKDLSELHLVCKHIPVIYVHCDCKSTDKYKQKNSNVKMNSHFKVRHKSIRYHNKNYIISIDYIKTIYNLAD